MKFSITYKKKMTF